jgi:glutamate synthase domain-containing protein 1
VARRAGEPEAVGELGRGTMPFIRQIFVGRGKVAPEALDRHLFIARKLAENEIRTSGLDGASSSISRVFRRS